MGGKAFDDLEPLTSEEYAEIVNEITVLIDPICNHLEPYIPLPEKTVHGDIDFLLVLKPGYTLESVRDMNGRRLMQSASVHRRRQRPIT